MTERLPLTPEQILKVKDALLDQWQQLPTEHQATMALVLVGKVMDKEWGTWLIEALALRQVVTQIRSETSTSEETVTQPAALSIPVCWISREDLQYCRPDCEKQIRGLKDSEVERIAEKIGDALRDSYWLAMGTILDNYLGEADDIDDDLPPPYRA